MTGEEALLQHATQQMKKIASDAQRSAQERAYMRSLRCTVEDGDTHKEMSYVQSVLVPIKQWADKQLEDYHSKFGDVSTQFFHYSVHVLSIRVKY